MKRENNLLLQMKNTIDQHLLSYFLIQLYFIMLPLKSLFHQFFPTFVLKFSNVLVKIIKEI